VGGPLLGIKESIVVDVHARIGAGFGSMVGVADRDAQGSETVWKPATAKNGSDAQLRDPQNSLFTGISRTTAINGGDLGAHGKEGVDGSSPSEGSAKAQQIRAFSFRSACTRSSVQWVWSRLWSFQVQNARSCQHASLTERTRGCPRTCGR
jgi:hypothetical protein